MIYAALSITALYLIGHQIPTDDIVAVLVYFANYHYISPGFNQFVANGESIRSPFTITWSLAVEEHFYLIFPLLIIEFRNNVKWLLYTLTGFIIAVLMWRAYLVYGVGHLAEYRIEMGTDTRLDSIAYGCILSIIFFLKPDLKWLNTFNGYKGIGIGIFLIFVSLALHFQNLKDVFSYSLQGIGAFAIFTSLFGKHPPKLVKDLLETKALVYVGTISYSLYLYHYLAFVLARALLVNHIQIFLATWIFAFIGAMASYYYIESPARKIRITKVPN